jgi:hypothetical protein
VALLDPETLELIVIFVSEEFPERRPVSNGEE